MFSDIDIGIKTFLRNDCLFAAVDGILKNFRDARMIIADDGEMTTKKLHLYSDLSDAGHIVSILSFDSGFGMKSNEIAKRVTRPYYLVGSDDFDFSSEAALGVSKLKYLLNRRPDVDIASGRVNNRPYEFLLNDLGSEVTEVAPPGELFIGGEMVDLTVNYSLMRNRVLDRVFWDDDVKIGGGEHGAFFLDCKRAGFKTAWVPGVNINEQQVRNSPTYNQFRARANSPDRPCFKKRGIRKYVLGDGRVDYEEKA